MVTHSCMYNHIRRRKMPMKFCYFVALPVYFKSHLQMSAFISVLTRPYIFSAIATCHLVWSLLQQNLIVDELRLAEIGPKFEYHEMFPARTNTGQISLYFYDQNLAVKFILIFNPYALTFSFRLQGLFNSVCFLGLLSNMFLLHILILPR